MVITDKMIEEELLDGNNDQSKKSGISGLIDKIKSLFFEKKKGKIDTIKNEKNNFLIVLLIALVVIAVASWYLIQTINFIKNKNNQAEELAFLKNYEMINIEGIEPNSDILSVVQKDIEFKNEIELYNKHFEQLNAPYENFSRHLFLPSLNIWKDPYTGIIDTSLIGQKFIENNPYEDIRLIQTWTNFFKDVGYNTEYNDIRNVSISDIKELDSGLFKMAMSIEFIAPSKRSFLLLINKLSMTSNTQNISLINEFMYHIWEQIKSDKPDYIESIRVDNNLEGRSDDKVIGYELYNWVKNGKESSIVDEKIIDNVIMKLTLCGDQSNRVKCYYKFRDKYSSLPTLAYTIGLNNNKISNKTYALKEFLSNVPVLISLTDFSFDKINEEEGNIDSDTKYKGTIKIDLYGRGVTNEELEEISVKLGEGCFGNKLTPQLAIDKINDMILDIGQLDKIDTDKSAHLWEMKSILSNILKKYDTMTNYERTVKLFEIDRMLTESNLCLK